MSEYLIRCVNMEYPYRHIVSASIQRLVGDHYGAAQVLTTAQVLAKMAQGDVFNTYSPSTDKVAEVHKDTCRIGACSFETIRSAADAVADNNLENLAC
jgi:hypothetical protein